MIKWLLMHARMSGYSRLSQQALKSVQGTAIPASVARSSACDSQCSFVGDLSAPCSRHHCGWHCASWSTDSAAVGVRDNISSNHILQHSFPHMMGIPQRPSDKHLEQLLDGPLEGLACLGGNTASDGGKPLYLHTARILCLLINRVTQVHPPHPLGRACDHFEHVSGKSIYEDQHYLGLVLLPLLSLSCSRMTSSSLHCHQENIELHEAFSEGTSATCRSSPRLSKSHAEFTFECWPASSASYHLNHRKYLFCHARAHLHLSWSRCLPSFSSPQAISGPDKTGHCCA